MEEEEEVEEGTGVVEEEVGVGGENCGGESLVEEVGEEIESYQSNVISWVKGNFQVIFIARISTFRVHR